MPAVRPGKEIHTMLKKCDNRSLQALRATLFDEVVTKLRADELEALMKRLDARYLKLTGKQLLQYLSDEECR